MKANVLANELARLDNITSIIKEYFDGKESYKKTLTNLQTLNTTVSYIERGKGKIKVMVNIQNKGTKILFF